MFKKLICIKKYNNIKPNQIINFIYRSKKISTDEKLGIFHVGSIFYHGYHEDYDNIYYRDYLNHFCTLKRYRKLKIKKINAKK